jgi:sec-independent protein translocase protein TatA
MVLAIALLVFGPTKLPEMARQAGRAIRDFKGSIDGAMSDDDTPRPGMAPVSRSTTTPAVPDLLDEVLITGDLPAAPTPPTA